MNTVSLIGHLTRDPEQVETKGGSEICSLRLALDRRGEQEGAIYTDVKTFGRQAEVCAEHLEKGRQVAVDGHLEFDEWEGENGVKRSQLYVIGERVEFLGAPKGGGGGNGSPSGGREKARSGKGSSGGKDYGGNRGGGGGGGRGSWRRD